MVSSVSRQKRTIAHLKAIRNPGSVWGGRIFHAERDGARRNGNRWFSCVGTFGGCRMGLQAVTRERGVSLQDGGG